MLLGALLLLAFAGIAATLLAFGPGGAVRWAIGGLVLGINLVAAVVIVAHGRRLGKRRARVPTAGRGGAGARRDAAPGRGASRDREG